MTAFEVIALIILAMIIGFVVGYFMYLIKRWLEKKRSLKKIKEQNLRFRNCDLESFKEVLKENEQEEQDRKITKRVRESPKRRGFGRAYQ